MQSKISIKTLPELLVAVAGVLAPALQIQLSLVLGFIFCIPVSLFYFYRNNPNLPAENPRLLFIGLSLSLLCVLVGNLIQKLVYIPRRINLRRGAWIVVVAWFLACTISAVVYFLSGFPNPLKLQEYTLWRRVVDSYYESVSGFGTAGTSILPSVEIFPRGLLLWRSITQWIGAMGIAFLSITVVKNFVVNRSEIINSEVESPNQLEFSTENEAISAGFSFLSVLIILTTSLFVLLFVSGLYFRQTPYSGLSENLFDSLNYSISTVATGGFAIYDTSVGLPKLNGVGGLQNSVSEVIISFFMLFSATNFVLWFAFFKKRNVTSFWKSVEFKTFIGFILVLTASIWFILDRNKTYENSLENLKSAFFNVSTVISTTGLATQDFTKWPIQAQGLIFSAYLIGGCVGSTSGGLKFLRFIVLFKYVWMQARNLIFGRNQTYFSIDGIRYGDRTAAMVMVNMILYFIIFLGGSIMLMLGGSKLILQNGVLVEINFETAFTAAIANLGGIGPAVIHGVSESGPVGNYYAFSEFSKIVLMIMIFIGRIGVLSFVMLFITRRGQQKIYSSEAMQDFDSDLLYLTN